MVAKVETTPKDAAVTNKSSVAAWEKSVKKASAPKDELGKGQKRPEGDNRSDQQIIDDTAVRVAHDAIAHLADRHLGVVVGQ